jgi:hypothetical protein
MKEVLGGVLGQEKCGCTDEKGGLNAEKRKMMSLILRRDNED